MLCFTVLSSAIFCRALGYDWAKADQEKPKQWQVVSVQAGGGVTAGAISSILTTPLDTIKTRLQVKCFIGKQKNTPNCWIFTSLIGF